MKSAEYRAMEINHIRKTNGEFAALVAQNIERAVQNIGPVTVRYQLASHESIDTKLAQIPFTNPARDRVVERMHTNSTLITSGIFFLEVAGRFGAAIIATKVTNIPEVGIAAGMFVPSVLDLGLSTTSAIGRGVNGLRQRVVSRFAKNS